MYFNADIRWSNSVFMYKTGVIDWFEISVVETSVIAVSLMRLLEGVNIFLWKLYILKRSSSNEYFFGFSKRSPMIRKLLRRSVWFRNSTRDKQLFELTTLWKRPEFKLVFKLWMKGLLAKMLVALYTQQLRRQDWLLSVNCNDKCFLLKRRMISRFKMFGTQQQTSYQHSYTVLY